MSQPVGGIYLQNGGYEQQNYPLVVHVLDVVKIATAAPIVEQRQQELIRGVGHEDAGEHEEQVCYALNALQPADNGVVALVALHELHEREKNRAQQEHPAHHFLLPHESVATCANDHQHASGQKYQTLSLIQLFHFVLQSVSRRRSVRRYPHPMPS